MPKYTVQIRVPSTVGFIGVVGIRAASEQKAIKQAKKAIRRARFACRVPALSKETVCPKK